MSYQGWQRVVQPHPSGGFYVAVEEANAVRDELVELRSRDVNRVTAIEAANWKADELKKELELANLQLQDAQNKCLGFEQGQKDAAFEREQGVEVLVDVLNQACQDSEGKIDSMALSAYADGLRYLEGRGRFKIEKQYGRRVIGDFIGPAIPGKQEVE